MKTVNRSKQKIRVNNQIIRKMKIIKGLNKISQKNKFNQKKIKIVKMMIFIIIQNNH